MIKYPDGMVAMRGDRAICDGMSGVIDDVIDSVRKQAEWEFETMGLMLATSDFGLVFEPVESIDWDCFEFLPRADEDE